MMSEEELQHKIEAREKISGRDAQAYRKVFDALEHEPEFGLPLNFADAVMSRIESKRESRKEYFVLAGGILFFVIATVVTYFMLGIRLSTDTFKMQTGVGAYQFVKDYAGLFIFGAAFILLLQWFDKRFIKPTGKRLNDLSM